MKNQSTGSIITYCRRLLKLLISICLPVGGRKPAGCINKFPHSAVSLRFLSFCFAPDKLCSVSFSHSRSLVIDRKSTGGCGDKINKESVAMKSSLSPPNMKGGIIICHSLRKCACMFDLLHARLISYVTIKNCVVLSFIE